MPVMDKVEETMAIRSSQNIGPKKDIPIIIVLTAYAMQSDIEKFLEAGMNDYLANPVDMKDLEKTLSTKFALPTTGNIMSLFCLLLPE